MTMVPEFFASADSTRTPEVDRMRPDIPRLMSEAIAFSTGQPSATAFRMSFPTVESMTSGRVKNQFTYSRCQYLAR
jgi:hypothetical protein